MDFSLIKQITKNKKTSIIKWRRLLYQHPEIGLDLPFTKDFVVTELEKMGLKENYHLMNAGIVVDLSGGSNEYSSHVALRVDMDALPLQEKTGLPYSSTIEGHMHACGHDAHTAMGLGILSILQELKSQWKGRIRIIFQSGEEELKGAKLLLGQRVLDNPRVSSLLGLHLDPQFPLGTIGLKSGQLNAYADKFSLSIKGKSGASPHLSIDPLVAASFAIQALFIIVSRNISPRETAVISIGQVKGGDAFNVIPDNVMIGGTVRSLRIEIRDLIFTRIKSIIRGLEESFGVETDLSFLYGSPPVICDANLTKKCIDIFNKILEEKSIINIPSPQLGGDDFAFFAQMVPSVLIRLGCRSKDNSFPLHSAKFQFDEEVLEYGTAIFSYLLINLASEKLNKRGSVV